MKNLMQQQQKQNSKQSMFTQTRSRQTTEDIKKSLNKIQTRMQALRNQMDFVEIFSHFWPLPNMQHKMKRLENEMHGLNSQYQQYMGILQSMNQFGLQN